MGDTKKIRYALITGAGSGLGHQFCLQLAAKHWHVVAADINAAAAKQTVAELSAKGSSGQAEQLDVADLQSWIDLRNRLQDCLPRIDLLINNAGICSSGELGCTSLDSFKRTVDVNLYGVIHGCHTMIPWLKETSPGGHIVNIASIFGVISPPAMGAYNLSKAGVIALSETLVGELLPHEIGVTVVMPGFFATGLLDSAHFETKADQKLAKEYMQNATITAKDVVDQTLMAIENRKLYVVLGSKAKWYWRFKRLLPQQLVRTIALRYLRKLQERKQIN